MNNILSISIGVLIIVSIGTMVFFQTQGENREMIEIAAVAENTSTSSGAPRIFPLDDDGNTEDDDGIRTNSPVTTGAPPVTGGITLAIVADHSIRTNCWSVIDGNVYDLTSWVPKHPGGEGAILKLCGTDGSASFNRKHGGAPTQAKILAGFKIGVLVQ